MSDSREESFPHLFRYRLRNLEWVAITKEQERITSCFKPHEVLLTDWSPAAVVFHRQSQHTDRQSSASSGPELVEGSVPKSKTCG